MSTTNQNACISNKKQMCIQALKKAQSKHSKYLSKNDYEKMDMLPCAKTIIKVLGNGKWSTAKRKAGLDCKPSRGQYTKKDCIEALNEAYEHLGDVPSTRMYDKLDIKPSRKVIKSKFETWNNAIESAGYNPRPSGKKTAEKEYSKKDCLNALKKAAKILGKSPTCKEYSDLGINPSYATIIKNFESFNVAKKKAGLSCYNDYSDEYIPKENNYGMNWYKIRQDILKSHNNQCSHCGCTRDKNKELYNKDLAIHHIIPFKRFDSKCIANHESNLVPLCSSCHSHIEYKSIQEQCELLNINVPLVHSQLVSS